MLTDSKSARELLGGKISRKQYNNNAMSRNGHKSKALKSAKQSESNKLKQMKKFYPEEYFRRSGYPFESIGS